MHMTADQMQMFLEASPEHWREIFQRLRKAGIETPRWRFFYAVYLKSDAWKKNRAATLADADGCCRHCGNRLPLQVHHKTYMRVGEELPDDLIALCDGCHEETHLPKGTAVQSWRANA